MNRIDQAISELASAFCLLKQHDEQLYTKAGLSRSRWTLT